MKKTKWLFSSLGIVMASALALAGCGSLGGAGSDNGGGSGILGGMFGQSESEQSDKQELTFEEIEELAEECSFQVHWYSTDGTFDSGTAFVMDSETHGQKLLVTAFHFLWPDDADTFTGEELPEYIEGGRIYYAKSGEDTGARLKNCLVIKDADAAPQIDKDVAAFTLQRKKNLRALPLSDRKVQKGEKLYLLASLWDTEDVHENCVYEAEAVSSQGGVLTFKMDSKYGTTGASGGPIVDKYGEVVAIHMASGGGYLYGHTAESFAAQIDKGTISDIIYPWEPVDEDEVTPVYTHAWDETMNGAFFDFQIDHVEWTDTVGAKKAPEGSKYVILDVSFDTREISYEDVEMFGQDFIMMWERDPDYSFRCDDLEANGMFGEKFSVAGNQVTNGRMAYLVPADVEGLYLYFCDYIYDEEDAYRELGDHLFEIVKENESGDF